MKWEKSFIDKHCTVTSSKRFHLSERCSNGIPFYCSKEIIKKVKGEEITDCDYISEEKYEIIKRDFGVPVCDDLLITTRGTYGIPYIYKSSDKFYFADGNLTWIKDFDKSLNVKFLYYWFLSQEGQSSINAIAKGTAQRAVPITAIKKLQIPLPPLSTQHRIASILSAYDDLIENNRRQIKLLEEAAQRLYKEWFVDFRFPGHENVRIVDGVPEGWEYRKLGEVANITMGQSPKSEFYNKKKEGLPFHQGVGSYGERFVKDEIYSSSYNRIATNESILFSVRAPVGRLNITKNKIAIGRGLSAINHKKLLQSFLFYSLKYKFFKDNLIGNGAIFSSITKEDLASQDIIIPNKDIDCKYNTIIQISDLKIKNLDEQVLKLTEARDRLLPKLMSGEIEV